MIAVPNHVAAKNGPSRHGQRRPFTAAPAFLLLAAVLAGCRTVSVEPVRRDFYAGRLERADERISQLPSDHHRDKVLYLMERGTVRQIRNEIDASTRDWLHAVDLLERSGHYSVSRGAASLVINDRTLFFRGFPYERTLLRTMLALNFLSRGDWQGAGVEARNIIANLENRDGFPDDAFSRYVAGFSLEMMNDRQGAYLQYRTANGLLDDVHIDERTGLLTPVLEESSPPSGVAPSGNDAEWIVFVLLGRGPAGAGHHLPAWRATAATDHAEFFDGDLSLGRSYRLADAGALLAATRQRVQILQAAKDVTRIAIKETIVQTLLRENEGLGMLAGVLLYSTEEPDTRRWETLPQSLQVARFHAPADMDVITIVYRGHTGKALQTRTLPGPFSARKDKRFIFVRDTPVFPPDQDARTMYSTPTRTATRNTSSTSRRLRLSTGVAE